MLNVNVPADLIAPDLDLVGVDGNAFAVLGAVIGALREAGNDADVIESYREQAMAGDYDHLIVVSLAFVDGA